MDEPMNAHDYAALAAQHGTPFYLYDMDAALAHYAQFASKLPKSVDLYYCVKANTNPAVLKAYLSKVPGLDMSSGGEVEIATRIGFDAKRMSFAGPGKCADELELAVKKGVGIVSVESPLELERLATIAAKHGMRQGITIRINPHSAPKDFPMRMGGGPSQFGIPEEDVPRIVEFAKTLQTIDLVGFHVYSGTNCLEPRAILENVQQTLQLTVSLSRAHDVKLSIVNLGGGFGIPYFAGQVAMDNDALAKSLAGMLNEAQASIPELSQTRFILELGRFLIGAYGVYVTRVVDVKEARGKRFVIMDGGMNHCFPATGNFGQLIKKNYPVQNLSRDASAKTVPQELVGPLCTPIDSMARALEIPRAEVGDLLAFMHCGAYSFGASPLFFLSHDTPLELVYNQGAYAIGRSRKKAYAFE